MNSDHENESEDLIGNATDGAEEIRDPLDGLVEKSGSDPGAAFRPEVLERLAALRKEDRAAFEALRSRLKTTGCPVTRLDEAIAKKIRDAGGPRPTQTNILVELAQPADLFHAPDGTGFADVQIKGHRETWPIHSKSFRRWLARRFFEATRGGTRFRGYEIGTQRDRGGSTVRGA